MNHVGRLKYKMKMKSSHFLMYLTSFEGQISTASVLKSACEYNTEKYKDSEKPGSEA